MTQKPWWMTTYLRLSLRDRLRVLFGVPVFVRFLSPDGNCHAACDLSSAVQREWPANSPESLTRGLP